MRRTILSRAVIVAVAASAALIQFGWNGRHRITDPYQPDRRPRRRMKSPAKRLVESAQKQRAKGQG